MGASKPKNKKETVIKPQGLTLAEVEKRISEGKINGDQNIKTKSVGQILRTNIFTFFNMLFLALALITFLFIPQTINGYMQFGFVMLAVFNTVIGIVQELRAKKTIDKLSLISAPKVTALRDGQRTEIAVSEIVLDDIIALSAGCQICADAVVVEGSIEVNESMITGEPDAIIKKPGDEIMSGSYVISGKALTKTIRVGAENYATKISAGAKYLKRPSSEILRSLNKIIKFMAIVIMPLGILLFLMKLLVHTGVAYDALKYPNILQLTNVAISDRTSEIILKTVGSLVGMIPSGLVALTSTVFCISVIRLSAHKTLAQDLYCVETLARVDVLCLDKTGTITEGSMEVSKIVPGTLNEEELKQALSNLIASVDDDNATSLAIKDFVSDFPATEKATDIIPFSSARKWSAASFGAVSYVLGAPEFVFKKPSQRMENAVNEYAEQGNRVLVLASTDKPVSAERVLPSGLKFLGYILITDKIRPEAPDTLRYFREQGVNIKIISGDNPVTVKCVAQRAGMENTENYIDLSTLKTEKEVIEAAEKYTIFGRVTPDQKLILVKSLKANGHTVAMTGDGVNDVLALKEADCSVAMASGSDAAKNVSSLVLLDNNFASMPHIVAEGRRSINNLERSAALYLVKTIYNFILALIFAVIAEQLPYKPNDMTIIGAMTIGIPSFFLALEPNKERIKGRFITKVLTNALPGALTVVVSVMGVVVAARLHSFSSEDLNSMFYIMTAFASFLYLGKVCYKFNKVRLPLYIAMLVIFISLFFMRFQNFDIPVVFGMPLYVTKEMFVTLLLIGMFSLSFFMNAVFIAQSVTGRVGLIEKIVCRIEKKDFIEKVENEAKELGSIRKLTDHSASANCSSTDEKQKAAQNKFKRKETIIILDKPLNKPPRTVKSVNQLPAVSSPLSADAVSTETRPTKKTETKFIPETNFAATMKTETASAKSPSRKNTLKV